MERIEQLRQDVIAALCTIEDPEIPINIYDLGLVYHLEITPDGMVTVRMTLTTPGCSVAQSFPEAIEMCVARVPGVQGVHVEVVWEPQWSREMMSEKGLWQMELL
ncbi:iron-sulfur cluster assembly protein [Candidatus Magnetaquicoccus inordinatus]|uniref:iron-sulfur cluster assembly protein n=1 Tax=Candidatus Magnetaquicoccus inordinatus TaxID=2496818 RepID=UPI00102B73EA|nr:iron-sulfur cluster assembly protein [Candidatus Magnetaquicoccus inordinatus]